MIILAETKPATVTFTLRFNVVSKNFSYNYRDSVFTCRGHKLESNLFTSLSELKKTPKLKLALWARKASVLGLFQTSYYCRANVEFNSIN